MRLLLTALLLVGAALFLLMGRAEKALPVYRHHQGKVFGTYYNIRYASSRDLEEKILCRFRQFDRSLSTFNPQSVISRINCNETDSTDLWFEQMYETAREVSELSDGAFDITVAPLVNAWGFGFRHKEQVTPQMIDSLLCSVGYRRVSLSEHRLSKQRADIMLDASAIAKGQACDVIADLLREEGCTDFLVDIGGEVVLQGHNDKGKPWKVGITKPVDDPTGSSTELQDIISSTALCMATSGNYRQFYYDNGVRRSHTVDPRTGYPVTHSLLSATVTAPSCMKADALATACMVLGEREALQLIDNLSDTECYLICAEGDTLSVLLSSGMKRLLDNP